MNQHQCRKSITGMMFLSILKVEDNIVLSNKLEETTRLCFDCLGDGFLHIPSQPTCIHFYLWVELSGQTLLRIYLSAAILVLPKGTTFNLRLKLLHPCIIFGKQITGMRCSKFCAYFNSFMNHIPPSLFASIGSKIIYIQFHRRKTTEHTDAFKIEFYKIVILKYICT